MKQQPNDNPIYCAGFARGQEHHGRGHYIPNSNPHDRGTPKHADWAEGYEKGWESAFYAKHQNSQPPASTSTLS